MLGHHQQVTAQAEEPSIVDEDAKRVQELEVELRVKELEDSSTEVSAKLELVKAIRNQFDKAITLASSSIHLQKATLGALLNSLVGVKPNLEKAKCIENEYRNMIIDMLGRIPLSDIPKQNIADLVKICHSVLFEDNEDNGAVAQKILADVHKAYKTGLEELSAPYFEWLLKLYENIPVFVDRYLGQKSRGKMQEIIPAVDSIKLSQDIALTVFSLFQSYSRRLTQFGETLVASMVKLISLPGPSLDQVSSSNMQMYTDFKISQVKTLVFLVILSRSSAAQPLVIGHKEAISDSLVLIMKTSPNVLILRKEILNAFRTILSSDELKDGLVAKIDELLNMDVLIGSDRTVGESLKQVAFIHLTELLLMVKQDLKVEFIERVVNMAMDSLSDVSVPLTLHVTSVRVLYNIVVDIIFPRRGEDEHFRDILSSILVCMSSKLDALCVQVPRILSISRDLESLHKRRKVGDANAAKEMAKESQIELTRQRQKLEGLIQVKPENDSAEADVKKEEVADAMDIDNRENSIDKEAEPVDIGVTLSSTFKTVYQATTHASVKERELLEFRNLAHGLVNTTKTVSFVIIVYHTSRGLKSPVPSHIKSWSSRKADVRTLSQIMKSALRFVSFFENLVPSIQSFDPRDVLCEMYNVIMDAHDYTDVVGPNVPFIFDTVLSNSWYLGFVRGLLEEESSTRAYSNRYAIACILDYLVTNKTHALKDVESAEGSLVLQLFQMCFETLPRIQNNDLQRAPQLAANGVPSVERVVQPHIIAFLKAMAPKLSEGNDVVGYMKAVRSLFFALASTNKFLDIQSSVGSSGLHTQIVEASLSLLQSPTAASKEVEEMCAEICLLVPARLEHLIPLIPRMMHAAVIALKSRDRSVHIALRVLDVWVESFNPEFIERSMSSVTKPLMTALWSHIKPTSQGPFGHKVAGMLGKMGGRGRRWLVDNVPVEYKEIPEYGLRVILAFPPHTSFLVPLDRCVQLAWSTVSSAANDSHKRKNALRLLQICAETLTRLHLPSKMLASHSTGNEDDRAVDGLDESNFEKFKELLFNSPEPPQIPSDMVWPTELGVKTKKQHAAEKKMLETVLTAIVSSSCVEEEIEDCKSRLFAHATCRHFAFLMASGWASMAIPPWAPPTSKMIKYDVLGGIPAYIATLKHLQPHILLDAFEQGLKRESAGERSATVECITVFLETLNEIGQLQNKPPSVENDAGKSEETKSSSTREMLSHDIPYLNIQQDLITRARHCCYGNSWASKLGGVLALEAITCRMSQPFLLYAAHYIVKALMTVLRSLPDSATVEIDNVTQVIVKIVSRALDSGSADGKQLDKKEEDSAEEEEEEEEEEPQVKTRRGKRAKRRTVSTRKKQRTSNTKTEKSNDGEHQAKEGSLDRDAARLQNDLLQAVMSSKNNDAVRKAATKCLELLSASSGVTVGSILEQILSRQPASKSLLERRVLPLRSISAQTNYAHSMAFLFSHCPNLPLTDSLGTFVADCCTILEQDDATILSCTSIRGQPPKQSIVVKLRIACLEVLVAALSWPQFRDAENIEVINHKWESLDPRENISQGIESLRTRIVNVFLQKLGSSDKIVDLSKRGLTLAVEYKLLEKIKLQEPLKQILVDVGLLNRLNVDHLNHLHSLLDIISDQFQITLGEKLVEHLQAWVEYDVKVVHELSRNGMPHSWEPGTECEVAVKMLDVFHKLPSWASAFLESQVEGKTNRPGLVVLTIGLEQGLPSLPGPAQPSKCWSPYRDPLVKFLNNYPDKSIDYFVKTPSRLATTDYFTMFLDIIQHPSGSVLLDKLKSSQKLLLHILEHQTGTQDMMDGKDNCIELVKIVCDLCPSWLPEELFQACYVLWRSGKFAGRSFEHLSLIILNYIRRNQHQTSVLVELPSALVGRPGSELTILKEYLMKDFPRESSLETKKMVLSQWVDGFKIDRVDMVGTVTVRFLLRPMVEWLVTHNQTGALTPEIINSLVVNIFCTVSNEASECDEMFQAEVIRLCVILVQHVPHLIRDHKKQIIQYIWWTLKKDNIAKSYAFLCVAYFFKAFFGSNSSASRDENDTKLVLKAFFNMLRMNAHDSASREAVKQAIDHIIPILSEESDDCQEGDLPSSDTPDATRKKPIYPSALKRLLQEEGLMSPVMVLVMQMVVRNKETFYSSRLAFIPVMLASLNRYGLPNQSSIDNRILAVDMAVTMYWWDEKARVDNENGVKATMLTKEMDTNILNFLLRMTFVSCEVRDRDETGWKKLHAHCLSTLRDAARYRKDCYFKLQFFDKLLQNSAQQQKQSNTGKSVGATPVLVTGLRIVALFMEFQPANLVECCSQQIIMMIEPSIFSKNLTTIELVASGVKSFFTAYPHDLSALGETFAAAASVQAHILKILSKYLAHVAEVEQFSADIFWYACNCVKIMKDACDASPKSMDGVLLLLLRAMNRIAKEHSKQPQLGLLSAKGMPQETLSNSEFGSGAWFIYHALDVSVPSSLVLSAEHRKLFLSTVVELMAGNPVRQGQTHSGILFSVMHLLRGWLLDNSKDYLNPKESLVLLQRLAQVDRLHAIPGSLRQIWDKDFLGFLYTLITTKTESCFGDDVFTKVERPFCCGLQNPDPAVRSKFFKLYSERIPRDLFERLKYIIQTQEWEFLSNTFWLKHAVALLFDCLHMQDPVTLAYNSAHVPQLFDYKESLVLPTKDKSGGTSGETDPDKASGRAPSGLVLPEKASNLLQEHLEFLKMESGLRSESLVTCLIEQVQTDPLVAHHLWVLLFPIVWTSLEKEQQTGLAKPIIQLLSKEHHIRQSLLRPTVGQTLLDGISMSQPQPKIPAEMIKYMGRHFHAWHTAISMLESHVGLFPQDMRCFDAVCDLYSILGEEDMRCGLWQRRAAAPETSTAIALQQHGFIPQAQSLFLEMMSRGVSGDISGFTKSEMVLWHNQYLSCCMELNQWDTVAEYAKSVDNSTLRLEAAAKLYDWSYLKTMIGPNAQVEEGPEYTMVKAQMQMSDMTLLDVDKMCKTSLSQCILRWWQMPESSPWSYAPVLHSFQKSTELMESWRVMMEFSMQGGHAGHYQDLKDIADTWKLRTPNDWEPIQWWSDILTWRNHVYNTTIRQFSNLQSVNPNLHQLGYRDKAWSVNRLGHVARLHHLPETCIHMINTLYGFNAMEVQEAFVKVQEQAKAYMQKPSEYLHGLNLVNSTNLDYFQPAHHAEMMALKGEFLHLLNDSEAHDTFSESLSLWPLCTDAWVNWGRFCDSQYSLMKQKEQKMITENAEGVSMEIQPQIWMWLEYTTVCYIQAIRSSAAQGKTLVPRLLHLLVLDVNGQRVGKHLVQHLTDIPPWVWLPWLPQMIVGLQRPEEETAKRILGLAATHHPQFVYWRMRPALSHLKDVAYKSMSDAEKARQETSQSDKRQSKSKADKSSQASDQDMPDASPPNTPADVKASSVQQTPGGGPDVDPSIEKTPEMLAYGRAKQVMEPLRAKQVAALQTLDLFIAELGQRFAARTDERLLAVVYTLQHRTYRVPLPSHSPIPESLCKELSSVCKACSSAVANLSGKSGSSTWNHWNTYQMKFANDLDMTSESAPKNLGELGERLKGWRTMMEAIIEDTNPSLLRLEDLSPALMDMALDEIEMPCQSIPSPDGPEVSYIEKMSADVQVVRRACSSSRRLSITGSDGQSKYFLVTGQQSAGHGNGEERIGQLLRASNALLDSHPESRRRGLRFAAPRSHTLYPSGRIVEDDPSNCLYTDAYDTFCARYGKEPDAPIIKFKEKIFEDNEEVSEDDRRKQAFTEIVDPETGLVTENIFSQYMYKTMVENSRMMWTFKRQFALSTALSAIACFVLRLAGRSPSKLVVSKSTGELTHLELVTLYNDRLQLDINGETVPFRFTRNMAAFIGPHGLEGALVAAGVAAAQALQQEQTNLPSLLALFLRDDVLAFIQRRLAVRSVASIGSVSPLQVENAVMHNVGQCLSRLERIGPKNSVTAPVDNDSNPRNPQKNMKDLLAMANNPQNLCKMDPLWQPWF